MRLWIVAVGRLKAGPELELYRHYAARLTLPMELREVEEKRKLPPDQLKIRENDLLLAALPKGAAVVALDEKGKALASAPFAARLGGWRDEGRADVAFVIGGADGLADSVRKRADLVWSLGAPTWPHRLVRALLVEQLYRAQCILGGHPYHRE